MAGWDMVIFEGKSAKPVYLFIEDDVAELRDAAHLWGKSVWDTEGIIKKQHQDPLIRVSSIGLAGENQVLFAAVVNDLHRAAGRSGVGAVMGSKNLKAIAVRGTKGVGNIANPKEFMRGHLREEEDPGRQRRDGPGPAHLWHPGADERHQRDRRAADPATTATSSSRVPRTSRPKPWATPRATDGKKPLVTNQACFGCTIACGRIQKIDQGHFSVENKPQYWGASGGLEYEAAWALGAANGVNDLEALQYANLLCNEQGMDPISFGATVGAVMELYEMGVITQEQLGIEAPFGSARALCELAEKTATGQGFGKEIGQGSKRLCTKYGHPELSMSTKGQEFPAYDSRGIQGMGLTYATSNRGGCHLRSYTVASEVLGIPVKTDPLTAEGKPELVMAFQDATAAFDSAGICIFTSFAWGLADVQPQVAAACGDEFTLEKLQEIGERVWNMEREFNNAAGFTAKDDSLPPRLLNEPAKTGPAKGLTNKLPEMLPKYYAIRGWDTEGPPEARDARATRPLILAGLGRADLNRRSALFLLEMQTMKHVILGAGPAGVIAAETIRKHAPLDEIVIVGDEPEPPYSRMAIPYLLVGDIKERGTYLRKGGTHFSSLRIEIRLARARQVDTRSARRAPERWQLAALRPPADRPPGAQTGPPAHPRHRLPRRAHLLDHGRRPRDHGAGDARCARAADGGRFHRLHHHGGAGQPRREALGGRDGRPHGAAHDGPGRRRHDSRVVREEGRRGAHRQPGSRASRSLRRRRPPRPRWPQRPPTARPAQPQGLLGKVVSFLSGGGSPAPAPVPAPAAPVATAPFVAASAPPKGLRVRLSGGKTMDCDLVISATGVKPAIDYLEGSGVKCLQGVLTDEFMATSAPGVYAAGDCAEALDLISGKPIISAIQPNAAEQARVAALNMAGQRTVLKGVTQINVLDTLGPDLGELRRLERSAWRTAGRAGGTRRRTGC